MRCDVETDAGVLRPQLVFKKAWPWVLIEAIAIVAMIGAAVMLR